MKVTRNLQDALNNFSRRDKLEVLFINGQKINGYISKLMEPDPIQVELTIINVLPGEDKSIWLDFDKIERIFIYKNNGEVQIFE